MLMDVVGDMGGLIPRGLISNVSDRPAFSGVRLKLTRRFQIWAGLTFRCMI